MRMEKSFMRALLQKKNLRGYGIQNRLYTRNERATACNNRVLYVLWAVAERVIISVFN